VEDDAGFVITGNCAAEVPFHFIAAVPARTATRAPAADLGHLIHLSFSQALHEKALTELDAFYPRIVVRTDAVYERRLCLLVHEYLRRPAARLPGVPCSPFLEAGTDFQKTVWQLIAAIPYGRTRTYGDLARMLGSPSSARAVGRACQANPLALIIPCHRVVGAAGIGGFAGGVSLKGRLLELESKTSGLLETEG